MSRGPKYPLEVVLGVRQREKDEAQEQLAEAMTHLEEAEAELVRRQQEHRSAQERARDFEARLFEPDEKGAVTIAVIDRRKSELRHLQRQIETLAGRCQEQEAIVEQCRRAIVLARQELTEAVQALKAIEKHRGRWKDELERTERRKEEQMMQEVSTAKWIERRREGGRS